MKEQLKQKILAKYPEWHKQPLRLTIAEIENPKIVLSDFFDSYSLPTLRACLKVWLDDALTAINTETKDHVSTYDDIEKLAEAAWLIYKKQLPPDSQQEQQATSALQTDTNKEFLPDLYAEWKKVNEFFGVLPLTEACNDLWEMTKRALTNPPDETSARDRNMMLWLYENTIQLYKSVHALLQKHKQTAPPTL